MEYIGQNKILYHLDRIVGKHRPITADIFLNNFCNNRCSFCTYARWELEKNAQSMRYEDFTRYAIRLISLGVKGFVLTGGGEPTITEDFPEICKWLESNKLHYGVNTNFNVYHEIAPDYLKISLDGWDTESYKRIRGVDAYSSVRDNIKRYLKWREHSGAKTNVGIQKVVENPSEILDFYSANHDLDVDYIVFRPIESTCGFYYCDAERMNDVKVAIKMIENLSQADKRVQLNFKWHLLGQREKNCPAQWAQIALNEKGEVMYCCHKPFEIVGHIMDDDILEKKAQYQTNMLRCDTPCRMTAVNRIVANIEGITEANFL